MEPDGQADTARAQILAAHAELCAEGVLEPLAKDAVESRRWLDCELASLVENRFFQRIDPLALSDATRALWEPRATSNEPLSSPHGHDWYRLPYWLLEGGERAGTIALSTSYGGVGMVTISSLFVLPSRRRRGVAARALRRAQAAVRAHGERSLRVPAYWTWQPAVRFYLDLGLWVMNWKHSVVFAFRDELPSWRIDEDFAEQRRGLRFCVTREGRHEALIEATREGDRLVWTELPAFGELCRGRADLRHRAAGTFALALAVRGFPLVRSPERWAERLAWADGGEPEGLAHKIETFEAWERECGHEVRTPRVPGLAYHAWDEGD
jgi:GNAT superfamily N-acetyltransferase